MVLNRSPAFHLTAVIACKATRATSMSMTGSHGCTTCGAARREKRRSSWPDRLTAARSPSPSPTMRVGWRGAWPSMRLIEVMTCRILECMLGRELAHAVAKVPYGEDDALETLTRMESHSISRSKSRHTSSVSRAHDPSRCLPRHSAHLHRARSAWSQSIRTWASNWQPTILVVLVIASKVYFDGLYGMRTLSTPARFVT